MPNLQYFRRFRLADPRPVAQKSAIFGFLKQADLTGEMAAGIAFQQVLSKRLCGGWKTEILETTRFTQQEPESSGYTGGCLAMLGNLLEDIKEVVETVGPPPDHFTGS